MRKIIKYFLLVLVMVMVCTSCDKAKGFDDYANDLSDSMNTVKTITINAKAFDSIILVYEYNNETSLLETGDADVTKTITSLNNSFELETKTEKSVIENVQRDKLLNFNFNKDLMDNLVVEGNKITCTLNSENLKSLLNASDLTINGEAKCEFIFTDNKINNIKVSFDTVSSKNVEVNVSYLY